MCVIHWVLCEDHLAVPLAHNNLHPSSLIRSSKLSSSAAPQCSWIAILPQQHSLHPALIPAKEWSLSESLVISVNIIITGHKSEHRAPSIMPILLPASGPCALCSLAGDLLMGWQWLQSDLLTAWSADIGQSEASQSEGLITVHVERRLNWRGGMPTHSLFTVSFSANHSSWVPDIN